MRTWGYALLLVFGPAMSWVSIAATCSCASVPLANHLQSGGIADDRWLLSLSLERHEMNDLVSDQDRITDETARRRSSDALLLELGYGLNERWSLTFLSNYIEHRRQIGDSPDSKQSSRGVGDSLLLLKFVPQSLSVLHRHAYGVGLGVKVSSSDDDEFGTNGVRYAQDMQPSSGASGTVIWGYYAHSFSREARNTVHFSVNASFNQSNHIDYKIGDDVNLTLGWQSMLTDDWRLSLQLAWREAEPDERIGSELPNTGGQWLDFRPSLQYRLHDNHAIRLSMTQPVQRELNGALQFTTSQAWSIGFISQF